MENPFVKLFAIDFKDHLEVKKSGNTELKYVSWAYAWAEVKKLYPSASYEVKKFNGLPYVYDPITGFMVYTTVTIEGVSHEMWLPVLDSANKAMKATPYTYNTPKWDYNPQTRHLGECYEGRISGVTQRGLFIELENGVEGFVPASSLTATGTMLTEGVRLSDPVSGKNWNLGDTMMITIVRADVNLGKIDFEVAPESAKK